MSQGVKLKKNISQHIYKEIKIFELEFSVAEVEKLLIGRSKILTLNDQKQENFQIKRVRCF